MKTIIIEIISAYAIFVVFAYLVSDYMIFIPPRSSYKNTENLIPLATADGETIYAIYLPNKSAKYTILVSHGNAEDLGYMLPFLQAMHDHGFSVFSYDYHGYGLGSGRPTEYHSYLDADAAYDYLTKKLNVAPENIIIYGHSVGAAVALDLAIRKPASALILQGAFVTAFRVITLIPLIPFDKFNNLKKIKKLKCPLLVIHGTNDTVVPFWQGEKLYNVASVPKQFYRVEGAGHNDVLVVVGEEYWQVIKNFVKDLGK